MTKRNKLIILAIVAIAVILVLAVNNRSYFSTAEKNQFDFADTGPQVDKEKAAEVIFSPTEDPYAAYLEARQNEVPIVLEFYARW